MQRLNIPHNEMRYCTFGVDVFSDVRVPLLGSDSLVTDLIIRGLVEYLVHHRAQHVDLQLGSQSYIYSNVVTRVKLCNDTCNGKKWHV